MRALHRTTAQSRMARPYAVPDASTAAPPAWWSRDGQWSCPGPPTQTPARGDVGRTLVGLPGISHHFPSARRYGAREGAGTGRGPGHPFQHHGRRPRHHRAQPGRCHRDGVLPAVHTERDRRAAGRRAMVGRQPMGSCHIPQVQTGRTGSRRWRFPVDGESRYLGWQIRNLVRWFLLSHLR
jgi:hypothetical protein